MQGLLGVWSRRSGGSPTECSRLYTHPQQVNIFPLGSRLLSPLRHPGPVQSSPIRVFSGLWPLLF